MAQKNTLENPIREALTIIQWGGVSLKTNVVLSPASCYVCSQPENAH